jgi:hypothetical protein
MQQRPARAALPSTIERKDLDLLLEVLRARGYTVMGPVARDGAIVWDEVSAASELPAGWTDEQEAGRYRITPSDGAALFDWTVGPASPKASLHPAAITLLNARHQGSGLQLLEGDPRPAKLAFFGLRACELAAIAVQDRVLLGGTATDPVYRARREGALLIAVQCGRAGRTCFCASMGTGPEVRSGHDLVLTELLEGERHVFVAEAASERGGEILAELPATTSTAAETGAAHFGNGPHARDRGAARPARAEPGAPALGRDRRALPGVRQLHLGLSDLLLRHDRGLHRPRGGPEPQGAALGLLLLGRLHLHPRGERALVHPLALSPVAHP